MRFTTVLEMTPTGETSHGRPVYALASPLRYEVNVSGGLHLAVCVQVPANFLTDLASAPWGFRWLLSKWPEPAVLHDYLCAHPECSRFLADAIFRDAMAGCGVPLWRRVLAFYAVRIVATIKGIR